MIRTIEELEESIEAVQPQQARVTQFPRELKKFSSSLCELKESRTLVSRRDVETWRGAACGLRESSKRLAISRGVRSVVRALSIPNESSELLEMRGKVRVAVLHSCVTEQQLHGDDTEGTIVHKKYLSFHELTAQTRYLVVGTDKYSVYIVGGMIVYGIDHSE